MTYRILGLLALLAIMLPVAGQGDDSVSDDGSRFAGNPELAIPEFPEGIEWVNVDGSLSIQDLRGKIVIFDFWTYGCINCIHMIPVLHELEEKYAEELVVIGVHSAKFENESVTENIEQIVQRYGIEHPVINDQDFRVWRTYGINAWPTFMVVDPRGNVLALQAGEIPFEAFDQLITGMIEYFDPLGEINREPLQISPEGEGQPRSLLAFPGKVLADVDGNRLFIADSSHNRLVIADLTTYEVLEVIGTGTAGYADGSFDEAQFNKPQGMALRENRLYLADTNNHAIRVVDLDTQTVDTLAGTGTMGRGVTPFGLVIREPRAYDIRSPWDVELNGDTLYIAMAGTHQIWEMNLENNTARVSVGNGREALLNATLGTSELAQPSGLYYENGLLYFADSESSSIRVADYNNDTVMTMAGPAENTLFDFGDIEGPAGTSRLQHPLSVDGDGDGLLYVADTYNSRIKQIDQTTNAENLFGLGGTGGFVDGGPDEAEFDEPGGLDYVEFPDGSRKLFVADTNNHAIRVIDLDTEIVSTITFPNPEALQIADQVTVIGGNRNGNAALVLPEQAVSGGAGEIVIKLTLPEGYKLNDLAESRAEWGSESNAITVEQDETVIDNTEVRIPVTLSEGEGRLNGLVTIYFCEAVNESLCFIDEFSVEVPVSVGPDGGFEREIVIERELVPPQLDGVGGIN